MRLVNALGGRYLHHVFLGERMREGFWRLYRAPRPGAKATLLPNAFAYPPPAMPPSPRFGPLTLGHISNLTEEKGVARVIAIFERLRGQGRDVKMVLAGPIADKRLKPIIDAAAAKHGGAFDYRGAIYDAAKARFFADIDLFLLPSSLVDEADPLVIQEAYEAGADVMASDRGCIAERLRRTDAFLTLDVERDTAAVARVLDDLALNRATARELNWRHAREMHLSARAQAEQLLSELAIP